MHTDPIKPFHSLTYTLVEFGKKAGMKAVVSRKGMKGLGATPQTDH